METGERYTLTGLQRTYLESVRDRITDEDRAAEPVAAVDADGMVYWKQSSVDEQVMYMIAKWLWDEAVGE
jgi:hypothetical protein